MGNDRTSRTKWLRNCRGQSIVELALITPLILVALMIPVDFGMGLFTAHYTQNAVREGARIGSTMRPFDATSVENEVIARLPALLEDSSITGDPVTVTAALSTGTSCMGTVTVTASGYYNYGFAYRLMALIGLPVNPIAGIARTTEMRYEHQSIQYSNPC